MHIIAARSVRSVFSGWPNIEDSRKKENILRVIKCGSLTVKGTLAKFLTQFI